jgi:sulfite reductase (NADPH) flavoprotein alpha-component
MQVMYDRSNPYDSRIVERYRLNKEGSTKQTWHVALALDGAEISYRPGDSFGIFSKNNPELVNAILATLGFAGTEEVIDNRSNKTFSILEWLSSKANLGKPTEKLLVELALRSKNEELCSLQEADYDAFLSNWNVPELFAAYPASTGPSFLPQELTTLISPLLPRFYSIASSQNYEPGVVHLTVSHVSYEVAGKKRVGVCSHFLCDMDHDHPVQLYVQPTRDFLLPDDDQQPIIMIGPGTGVAPFRAFMQERMHRGNCTTKNWLFFGERNSSHDFFYEEFWSELVKQGYLHLDVAFSRDNDEKVYVQHRMWEQKEKFWAWLQEGAKIYVCGDASRMAKDVDACLQKIISTVGGLDDVQTRAYMTSLRKEKRYLRDVY